MRQGIESGHCQGKWIPGKRAINHYQDEISAETKIRKIIKEPQKEKNKRRGMTFRFPEVKINCEEFFQKKTNPLIYILHTIRITRKTLIIQQHVASRYGYLYDKASK